MWEKATNIKNKMGKNKIKLEQLSYQSCLI